MSASNSGGGGDVPSQIAAALSDSSKADIEKVGIALGVFVAASLATVIGFECLRANNKIVYEPKRKYADVGAPAPPPLSYSFLGWLAPVWRYTEDDMLNNAGMDAVVYLRFLRLCCWISTALAVVLGVTLIPVDLAYNLKYKGDSSFSSKSTALSIITIAEMRGSFLYAPIIMSYFAVAIALFFILRYYKKMVALRWMYFRSDAYQNSFAARTLMMTNVPKQLQSDVALSSLLSSIGLPYPTTEVHIGRVVGSLPELIEKHDETVRKLEHVLAKHLKDPNNVPSKRPTERVGKSMGVFGGQEVDSIDYYTMQINKIEAAIETWRERIHEKKPESYGFASMAAVPYAHAAAKSLKGKRPKGVEIELASDPRDILWKNLVLSRTTRAKNSTIGFIYLIVLMFVNAVPLLAVALIAQMSSFTGALGFLRVWQDKSGWSFSVVSGLVPPAISGIMGYFLPILMRKIAKYRGEQTRTKLDKVVTGQFFGFLVVSQFIIFSLIGVFVTSIATIVGEIVHHESAGEVFNTLRGQTLVIEKQFLNMSNYWLTWLPLRMWMSTFDLAQGLKLVLVWVQKAFFGRTPRDVREYTKPPTFEYATYYANFLFVFAVGALYGCLAPLVMIFTAACFWVSLACYKYQFMYVSRSKVESGGGLWRVVVNRMLVTLCLMQVILMFIAALDDTVSLGPRIVKIVICAPPIAVVLAFKIYCRKTFDLKYDWYLPDPQEMATVKVHQGDSRHNRLQRRFGHPSLHQKLFTPLVHARVKHLLPQVYRGKLEHSGVVDVAGRKLEAEEVMGGLKIAAVEDDQLEYDPKMDSDMQSIISTSTMSRFPNRKGTTDTQFQGQYQAYLAGGNPSRGDLNDTYEMNEMRDSQENLLEKRSHYAYSPTSHYRKPSANTLASYGTPYATPTATPGLEYPPNMDLSQQPIAHHSNASQHSFGANDFFGNQAPAYTQYASTPAPYGAAVGAGVGAHHVRQQRSNSSMGGMMAQPRRTDSPVQVSPNLTPTRPGQRSGSALGMYERNASASPAAMYNSGEAYHSAASIPYAGNQPSAPQQHQRQQPQQPQQQRQQMYGPRSQGPPPHDPYNGGNTGYYDRRQ